MAGRAIIQSYMPENSVITMAAEQNYDAFYEEEISLRKALCYPPFCDLVSLVFSSFNQGAAITSAQRTVNELGKILRQENAEILGPSPCSLYKINNKYRVRVLIKCRLHDTIIRALSACMEKHDKSQEKKFVSLSIETNPIHIS